MAGFVPYETNRNFFTRLRAKCDVHQSLGHPGPNPYNVGIIRLTTVEHSRGPITPRSLALAAGPHLPWNGGTMDYLWSLAGFTNEQRQAIETELDDELRVHRNFKS